jgi:hypothetical protein
MRSRSRAPPTRRRLPDHPASGLGSARTQSRVDLPLFAVHFAPRYELTRSSPHFGLKRIEPVVEKIADHIGRRLQREKSGFLVPLVMAWSPVRASTPDDSRLITPETTSHSIPTNPATATPGPPLCTTSWPNLPNCHSTTLNRLKLLSFVAGDLCHQFLAHSAGWHNAACYRTASYCKLWLNLGHSHGSPAERKMAMVIGRPLLKLNASTRGPRS